MIRSALNASSPSFQVSEINKEVDQYFGQAERESYYAFIQNPSNKTFDNLVQFIELSRADTDSLPSSKKPQAPQAYPSPIEPALVQSFYIKHQRLNELEGQMSNENFSNEIQKHSLKSLEKMGKCLTNLVIDQVRQGSNGQYLFYMIDPNPNLEEVQEKFRNHSLIIDDRVVFCIADMSPIFEAYGSVYRLLHNGIVVSMLGIFPGIDYQSKFSLVRQEYQAAYDINNKTLEKLKKLCKAPGEQKALLEDLLRDCLEDKEREATDLSDYDNLKFSDEELNKDQKRAVRAALAAKDIFMLDGPAGTGKTRVIAELIYQCVRKGMKVLACAPNHISVDNMVERIVDKNLKCCRLGRPGSSHWKVDSVSLDELVKKNKRIKLMEDACNKLLDGLKATNSPKEKEYLLYQNNINKQIISIYQKNMGRIILHYCDVVFSTLQGAASPLLGENDFCFDIVIIDECSQATEIASWAPILRANKIIVAGDRLQLPPYIISQDAARLGFGFTLFNKLKEKLPKNLKQVLGVQYRMNNLIMAWSNKEFYEDKLKAHDICAQYTLEEFLKWNSDVKIKKEKVPVLMLATTQTNFGEEYRAPSYLNIEEGAIVLSLLEYVLSNYNLSKDDIGVISPYEAQHEMIAKAIKTRPDMRGIKCHSVDQFQGKEKEVIIISLVRSNMDKKVGFLDNSKRMNVSITRARRFVAIVCDPTTVCKPELPFLVSLVEHFKKNGQVKTAKDFSTLESNKNVLRDVLKKKLENNDLIVKKLEQEQEIERKAEVEEKIKILKGKGLNNGNAQEIEEVKIERNNEDYEKRMQHPKELKKEALEMNKKKGNNSEKLVVEEIKSLDVQQGKMKEQMIEEVKKDEKRKAVAPKIVKQVQSDLGNSSLLNKEEPKKEAEGWHSVLKKVAKPSQDPKGSKILNNKLSSHPKSNKEPARSQRHDQNGIDFSESNFPQLK